eukprot:scaffold15864_cov104-Skeletonema_dohrnii-CCMP3373.AAC.2
MAQFLVQILFNGLNGWYHVYFGWNQFAFNSLWRALMLTRLVQLSLQDDSGAGVPTLYLHTQATPNPQICLQHSRVFKYKENVLVQTKLSLVQSTGSRSLTKETEGGGTEKGLAAFKIKKSCLWKKKNEMRSEKLNSSKHAAIYLLPFTTPTTENSPLMINVRGRYILVGHLEHPSLLQNPKSTPLPPGTRQHGRREKPDML